MMRDVRQTALVFIVGVGIGKVIWSAPSAAPPVTPASLPCRLLGTP